MTSYRGMDGVAGRPGTGSTGTQPPASGVLFANILTGAAFTVTKGGCFFEGFWDWVVSNASTTPRHYALWTYNGLNPATGQLVVPGTAVTSGTITPGGWNYTPLPTPVPIAVGTPYIAAAQVLGAFASSQSQFNTGDPYAAGITNGPLVLYSGTTGSFPVPAGIAQGVFTTAGTDPWTTMPGQADSGGDGSTNFWIDVQVNDAAVPGYSGTWRFQPNTPFADYESGVDDNQPYNLATQFNVTSPVAPKKVWFYSPASAVSTAGLPTEVAIWQLSSGVWSKVWENLSPSWSGTYGTGWVSTAIPSGVSLANGTYKVAAYNKNGGNGVWSYKRLGFFALQSGFRQLLTADAVCGPITIPITANAALATDNITSASEPGQATYSVGSSSTSSPPAPNLYVSTAGSANGQFYGVDIEVGQISIAQGAAALAAPGTLTAPGRVTEPATGHLAAPASLAVAARVTEPGSAHLSAAVSLSAAGILGRPGRAALSAAPALGATGLSSASVLMAAHGVLTCSALMQRIVIPPGNVSQYGLNSYGPPVPDPWVTVPAVQDGIYDS